MRAPLVFVAIAAMAFSACGERQVRGRASYMPLADVESMYGALITTGNRPTPNQRGTGERVGLFQDASGTVWGLPLTMTASGAVLACAPPLVHSGHVTDTFPAGSTIIGSTNEPIGWRSGTGGLELLLRDAYGTIRWQAVSGDQIVKGPVCWAPEEPGPPRQLHYYRLAPHRTSVQ